MKNKHLIGIFLILLFLSVSFLSYTYFPFRSPPPELLNPKAPSTLNDKENISPTDESDNNDKEEIQEYTSPPPAKQNIVTEATVHAQMIIGEMVYESDVVPNTSLYDLMREKKEDRSLEFYTRDYPSLGKFVEEINGVKEDKRAGIYWLYYINNKPATIGISEYIIQPNDIITWKYEKAQF